MSLIASDSGGNFVPVPTGMHLARCYRVVDLGTQKSEYKGEITYPHKIMLQFEVHGEHDDGTPLVTDKNEPMSISKNYTLSLSDKANLRKDLQAWRGREFSAEELRGFDIKNILGAWAMITVGKSIGSNGKEYTNILNVNPVPKSLKDTLPIGHNKPAIFSIAHPDMELFNTFSDYLKKKIEASPEWQAKHNGGPSHAKNAPTGGFEDMDDDIPF